MPGPEDYIWPPPEWGNLTGPSEPFDGSATFDLGQPDLTPPWAQPSQQSVQDAIDGASLAPASPDDELIDTALEANQSPQAPANPWEQQLGPGDSYRYSARWNPSVQPAEPAPTPVGNNYPTADDAGAYMAPAAAQYHNALGVQAENQAELDRVQAEGAAQAAEVERNANLDRMAAEHANQKAVAAAEAKIQEINPARFWSDASAATKATSLAAAMIGGWLSVSTKSGRNTAMEALMAMVDNDIKAQIENQQNARSGAYRAERAGQRRLESIEVERAGRLRAIQQQILADGARFKSPITQAEYAKEAAKFDAEIGKNLLEHGAKAAEYELAVRRQQAAEMQDRRQNALGWASLNQRYQSEGFTKGPDGKWTKARAAPLELKNVFDGAGFGVRFERNTLDGNGHVVDVGDAKIAQEMNDAARKGTTVIQSVNRVLEMFEGGRDLPGTQSRELVQREMRNIMANYVLAEGRGLSDSDFKALQAALGDADPNRIFRLISDETWQKKLLGFRNGVQTSTENSLNRYQSTFGKVKFNPPSGTKLIDPPDSRLTWPQLNSGLNKELAKFDKADPARIVGYIEALGETMGRGGLVLGPAKLDLQGTLESIQRARDLALSLPNLDQDHVELINNAAATAMGKIAGEGLTGRRERVEDPDYVIPSGY